MSKQINIFISMLFIVGSMLVPWSLWWFYKGLDKILVDIGVFIAENSDKYEPSYLPANQATPGWVVMVVLSIVIGGFILIQLYLAHRPEGIYTLVQLASLLLSWGYLLLSPIIGFPTYAEGAIFWMRLLFIPGLFSILLPLLILEIYHTREQCLPID